MKFHLVIEPFGGIVAFGGIGCPDAGIVGRFVFPTPCPNPNTGIVGGYPNPTPADSDGIFCGMLVDAICCVIVVVVVGAPPIMLMPCGAIFVLPDTLDL